MMGYMNIEPRLWAILLIGPPGAGKDTQAELLATELGLVQIKTSKIIEEKIAANPNDPAIQEAIKEKSSGGLVNPSLVLKWVSEEIQKIHSEGTGLIASGSPRTLPEAEIELPLLINLYGNSGVKILNINVSQDESVKRNSFRRVCEKNNHPIPNFPEYKDMAFCPKDQSPIISRQDDAPETIRHRFQVYEEQTQPLIDFFTKKEYNIITIDGDQSIEDVHRDILDHLW